MLFASRNPGKLDEARNTLSPLGIELSSLDELGLEGEVEETGETFADNARLKAIEWSRRSGQVTLADDSGIEVDALDDGPGVTSARFGGPGLDDAGRNALLIEKLAAVPTEKRGATFRCVLVIARQGRAIIQVDGSRRGLILKESRGWRGFGYDPLFFVPELKGTFAELSSEVKLRESHRGRAFAGLLRALESAGLQGVVD